MKTNNITALTSRIESFPTLPAVVNRVMEITSDPESSANELMNVIGPDIALTASILKLANSAFFGLTKKVSSLQQAITVLGFKEIRNMIITKAVFDSFNHLKKEENFDIRGFWEHSFLCGLASKIIATDLNRESNEFFVAGLIHDIGKLVIYLALPLEYSKLATVASPLYFTDYKTEKTALGIAHDEVGMRLLKRWLFPESLVNVVGFHHRIHELENKSPSLIVVHVADLLAHIADPCVSEGEGQPCFSAETLYPEIITLAKPYGIRWNESDLHRFQCQLAESREKEAAMLNLFYQ